MCIYNTRQLKIGHGRYYLKDESFQIGIMEIFDFKITFTSNATYNIFSRDISI